MKHIIFVFLFFLVTSSVFSFGRREKETQPPQPDPITVETDMSENTITILGRVRIFGNEPFTFVGIVDDNGIEYAVYPPSIEDELRRLQGHIIEFTAVLLNEPQGYGGMFLKGGTVTPIMWEIQ